MIYNKFMKSKELKNYNLPDNRTYNDSIEAKPTSLFIFIMILGLGLLIFQLYYYGVALIFFATSCIFLLPNRVLIEFYDDHMILYNRARKDECHVIYYDDVKSWEYKSSINLDELIITLSDDSIQKIDGFSKIEFENKLNMYMKDKKVVNENRSNRLRNSK